jgi:hypothetical protein
MKEDCPNLVVYGEGHGDGRSKKVKKEEENGWEFDLLNNKVRKETRLTNEIKNCQF